MAIIKIQKIASDIKEPATEDVLASFCFHFQQYTFGTARTLPYKRILQMLKVARQEQAKEWYNLARAMAAPHSKDGKAYTSLLEEFKAIIQT